jgi:multisubunit Na+/H+ antiporter MnhC subunit
MDIAIITAIISVVALGVLFWLARRAVKLVVRLALAAILILLVAAGVFWWYWSGGINSNGPGNRPANTRRGSSSR